MKNNILLALIIVCICCLTFVTIDTRLQLSSAHTNNAQTSQVSDANSAPSPNPASSSPPAQSMNDEALDDTQIIQTTRTQSRAGSQNTKPWIETTNALGQIALPQGELNKNDLSKLARLGSQLFAAQFTTSDGAGRPMSTQAIFPTKADRKLRNQFTRTSGPDAGACASCHNQPFMGGAGDFVVNVFASDKVLDTIDPKFSHERGTNHLFGAGLIELLAREMTHDLLTLRHQALREAKNTQQAVRQHMTTKGVDFGYLNVSPDGFFDISELDGIDADLVIKPFTQKGVILSLRQFSVNAMNHHHGMQATERFGARWTGENDFDEDGKIDEVTDGDISAMVAWQATLPAPIQITPTNSEWAERAQNGKIQFTELGCTTCHKPTLPLKSLKFRDPGPFDGAGTLNEQDVQSPAIYDLELYEWAQKLERNEDGDYLIPLFGDLKRHKIADREVDRLGNELGGHRFVDRTTFITAELWGVGVTQPYGHRNDITTIDEIIRAHGGDARQSRNAYIAATEDDQHNIVAYLKTLTITEPGE